MSGLTINFRGLSGQFSLVAPEGATVADVRAQAGIDEALGIRSDGSPLADDAVLRDEQILVTTPPEAKHGRS